MPPKEVRLVFLCDIVDYSRNDEDRQRAMVKALWGSFLEQRGLLFANDDSVIDYWGTGDGLYLTTTDTSAVSQINLYKLASVLSETAKANHFHLRSALHYGSAFRVPLGEKERHEMCGPALNDCARIVAFARDDQVVFSEDYINLLIKSPLDDVSDLCENDVFPPRGNDPFLVEVKHGDRLAIRFDSTRQSRRMVDVNLANRAIERELNEVLRDVRSMLGELVGSRNISVRLTVFRPWKNSDGDHNRLRATLFRVSNSRNLRDGTSTTTYKFGDANLKSKDGMIIDMESCVGIARAFVGHSSYSCFNLPDPKRDLSKYQQQLEVKFGVPPEVSGKWEHKARSFFAIPLLAFDQEGERPLGVLCIDSPHPCEKLDPDTAEQFLEAAFNLANLRLSALLKVASGS